MPRKGSGGRAKPLSEGIFVGKVCRRNEVGKFLNFTVPTPEYRSLGNLARMSSRPQCSGPFEFAASLETFIRARDKSPNLLHVISASDLFARALDSSNNNITD